MTANITKRKNWDFPGGPVVRTPRFHCSERVQSPVRELRSCVPLGTAKKQKQNENKKTHKKVKLHMTPDEILVGEYVTLNLDLDLITRGTY